MDELCDRCCNQKNDFRDKLCPACFAEDMVKEQAKEIERLQQRVAAEEQTSDHFRKHLRFAQAEIERLRELYESEVRLHNECDDKIVAMKLEIERWTKAEVEEP